MTGQRRGSEREGLGLVAKCTGGPSELGSADFLANRPEQLLAPWVSGFSPGKEIKVMSEACFLE